MRFPLQEQGLGYLDVGVGSLGDPDRLSECLDDGDVVGHLQTLPLHQLEASLQEVWLDHLRRSSVSSNYLMAAWKFGSSRRGGQGRSPEFRPASE